MNISLKFLGASIPQNENGYYSATQAVKAGNKIRINADEPVFNITSWKKRLKVKMLIQALEKKYQIPVYIPSTGKNISTWVHPMLFIELCIALCPSRKIEIYEQLYSSMPK